MWILAAFLLSISVIGFAYWKDFQSDKKEFKISIKIALKNIIIIGLCIGIIELVKIIFEKL